MVNISDIAEIERATAHLIPQHPQYHYAGLMAFAYGGIALIIYWVAGAVGLPWYLGAATTLTLVYLAGRYDGGVAWRDYHRAFNELMTERLRNA